MDHLSEDVQFEVPVESPAKSVTPGARKILIAAGQLLASEGYDSLTYERVAEAAGVNKSTIRYNFGSKSALVTAVVDLMARDGMDLARQLPPGKGEDRVAGLLRTLRTILEQRALFVAFFEILPSAMRDPELGERQRELYERWDEENRRWLGFEGSARETDRRRDHLQLGLAQILVAIADGLSVRQCLEGSDFDPGAALDALGLMLKPILEDHGGGLASKDTQQTG